MKSSCSSLVRSLKARLREGEFPLYGLSLKSFSPVMAEISGHAGYDFVVVDMEHGCGGLSFNETYACMQALAAAQTPSIIRVPECSAVWAKKALDLGPQGIIFPNVRTPQQAQDAVSYCRYPPAGVRGVAHSAIRASKFGLDPHYLDRVEDELLIMCQIESEEGVGNVEEIAATDGLDCVAIGPTDLAADMGFIRDLGNEKAVRLVRKVEEVVLAHKPKEGDKSLYLFGFCPPHDGPIEQKKRGYHLVCGAGDVTLYRDAAVRDVLKFKGSSSL